MNLNFGMRWCLTLLTMCPSLSMSFKALVLRHGQTDANAALIEQGSADFSRLTSLGRQQAIDAYQAFDDDNAAVSITSIYSSPLTRARETLQGLRQGDAKRADPLLPATDLVLENLREIDLYDWEGKHETELQTKFPDSWKAWREGTPDKLVVLDTKDDSSCIERYPLLEMWERADRVWDEIFEHEQQLHVSVDHEDEKEQIALIVAHGNLGQALLGSAMGWNATQFNVHQFPNCGIAEIEFSDYNKRQPKRWRFKWPLPPSEWNYHAVP